MDSVERETFEQARMKKIGGWIGQAQRIRPAREDHAKALSDMLSMLGGHYDKYGKAVATARPGQASAR